MTADSTVFELPTGTFRVRLETRWGDLDALRHVNNTRYFQYFEEARVKLFDALEGGSSLRCPSVLAHASCDFLKPLLYPACIVVSLKLLRVGHSSLELECWIAEAEDPEVVHAKGRNVLVCVDAHTQRPVAWSPAQLQALQRCFSA